MTKWVPKLLDGVGPRYRQIADSIEKAISAGELKPDDKMPTHRALAGRLGVTTGTVTRAYAEAERRNLVYGVVGSGMYVRGGSLTAKEWQFMELPEPDDTYKFTLNLPLSDDRASMVSAAMLSLTRNPNDVNFLLEYQPDVGVLAHRQIFADWMARETEVGRWQPKADQVIVTNGGQHGIMIALMALCKSGDTVLAEALTYPGFSAISRQLELQVRPVEMDEFGVTPQSLEAACIQYAPRVLFCTPTLQNPTTATMPLERRQAIVDVCRRHNVLIIEDEVNAGLLEKRPTPLAMLAPEQVVHVCGFSKVLAAGLRVGCCVVPKEMQSRLGAAVRASCWMISPISAELVCRVLRSGAAEESLRRQRLEVLERVALAQEIFKGYPLAHFEAGLHVWLTLPEPWRADTFVAAAAERNVEIMSPAMFSISRAVSVPAVRLSLSTESDRIRMVQGMRILADLLRCEPKSFTVL